VGLRRRKGREWVWLGGWKLLHFGILTVEKVIILIPHIHGCPERGRERVFIFVLFN
jgi:hypothetical protein